MHNKSRVQLRKEVEKLESQLAEEERLSDINIKIIARQQAQLEAVRAYVEKHAGDGIDGDHVTWFKAAIGEVES